MTNKSDNSPEMDLETARSEIMTAFLVLGMSEASATEALEKVIEIFKEEGRKEERERLLNPKEGDFPEAIQEFITGMTVSVDVSRHAENDEECGLRYFGTLADFSGSNDGRDKHGLVVMVEKATPNFNFSHPGDSLILDWISKMFVASVNIFLALKGEDFSGQTGCSFRFDAAVTCGSTTGVFPL